MLKNVRSIHMRSTSCQKLHAIIVFMHSLLLRDHYSVSHCQTTKCVKKDKLDGEEVKIKSDLEMKLEVYILYSSFW